MKIHGLNKTTLLDYPGRVAATIFTGNCNFRCPFCHNASLVLNPDSQPAFSEEEVLSFLKKRKGILSGVCISGGEPTLQPDLPLFLSKIKELGYAIKLDTNGYRPDVLQTLLEAGLLDYIAMDIKSCFERYPLVCGIPDLDIEKIKTSMHLIIHSGLAYEFRTTITKELHPISDLVKLSYEIKGCHAYFLQPFQDSGDILGGDFSGYSLTELREIYEQIKEVIPTVGMRGVESF